MQITFLGPQNDSNRDGRRAFLYAAGFLDTFETFLLYLTDAAIFLTIMYLGVGILHARTSEAPRLRGPFLLAVKGTTLIIGIVAITYMGIELDYMRHWMVIDAVRFVGPDNFWDDELEDLDKRGLISRRLYGALTILIFVVSFVTLVFTAFVFVRVGSKHPRLRKVRDSECLQAHEYERLNA